jgi:uncharacterized protein YcnI
MVAVAAAAALVVLAMAGAAAAHVTVNPNTAVQGSYAKLTFRVPTEMDNASTTRLQVFFPQAEPLAVVSVKPHPGWTFKVTTAKLATPVTTGSGTISQAVSKVTWTADSAASAIKPGEFDEFDISTGPLPTAASMQFKALQTYSNGQIVRWIESATSGAAAPEHPAPVLTLTPQGDQQAAASSSSSTSDSGSGRAATALVLSIVALLVALAAGAAGVLRRSQS